MGGTSAVRTAAGPHSEPSLVLRHTGTPPPPVATGASLCSRFQGRPLRTPRTAPPPPSPEGVCACEGRSTTSGIALWLGPSPRHPGTGTGAQGVQGSGPGATLWPPAPRASGTRAVPIRGNARVGSAEAAWPVLRGQCRRRGKFPFKKRKKAKTCFPFFVSLAGHLALLWADPPVSLRDRGARPATVLHPATSRRCGLWVCARGRGRACVWVQPRGPHRLGPGAGGRVSSTDAPPPPPPPFPSLRLRATVPPPPPPRAGGGWLAKGAGGKCIFGEQSFRGCGECRDLCPAGFRPLAPSMAFGGGGVGTRPRYQVACLWRRLLASRHCSF